jgi:hypothetical protein
MSNDADSSEIPLSVVLEYKSTFSSKFKPSQTLLEVCQEALHSSWHQRTQPAEWKVTDRYGNELSMDSKLSDLPIPKRDTIFLSKKLGDISGENLLVQAEDKIGQKL